VVLNTSFNLRGEPVVNTPANAYSSYFKSEMDSLVLGNFLVDKKS
jgi:carbamoyltransferase